MFEAEVLDLDHEGRGVVRVDGKVVFVDDALPGERVRAQVRKRKRSFDEASLVEVLEASPSRVVPPCAHADRCGGCRLQHLSVDAQRAHKSRRLIEDLERIGRVEPRAVLEPLAGPDRGYRRKARLTVKVVPAKGGALIGFRERHRPYVADLQRCEVLVAPVGERIGALRALVGRLSVADRIPQLEFAAGDDGLDMVVRHLEPLSPADRAELAAFERDEGVRVLLQPAGLDSIAPLTATPDPCRHYTLPGLGPRGGDIRIRFRPTDFIQVNGPVNLDLVRRAVELLELSGGERVLDLFCGLGNFSLAIAARAGAVVGVEGEASLVEGARRNAAENRIANAAFAVGDLFQTHVAQKHAGAGYDRMLLDPPRSGAFELVKALAPPYPRRIVYVSCNPSTLARDAGVLVHDKGFTLEAAGLVDMFPHTAHGEALAVFVQSP